MFTVHVLNPKQELDCVHTSIDVSRLQVLLVVVAYSFFLGSILFRVALADFCIQVGPPYARITISLFWHDQFICNYSDFYHNIMILLTT
jgi:hypothetical protein